MQFNQQRLFDLLPTVPDLQSAWLLLLYCASPRVHYALRGVRPELSEEFADQHDKSVSQCLAALLQLPSLPEEAVRRAKLALRHGGLGLRSARAHAEAAYWASWADCLPAMRSRLPDVAAALQAQLELPGGAVLPSARSLADARALLVEAGADLPAWDSLSGLPRQDRSEAADFADFADSLRGWQRVSSAAVDDRLSAAVLDHLDPASQAVLASSAGRPAGRPAH